MSQGLVINLQTGEVIEDSVGNISSDEDVKQAEREQIIFQLADTDSGMARVTEELANVHSGVVADISQSAKDRIALRASLRKQLNNN